MLIQNGRSLIVQKLYYSDIEKAQEIYVFLEAEAQAQFGHAFSLNETFAFHILYQEWDLFLEMAARYEEHELWNYLYSDNILRSIMQAINANEDIIRNGMKLSEFSAEEEDLINLYFHLILSRKADNEYTQKLKDFKQNYPHSKYQEFVRNYLLGD